jgi:hypothetical protein
MFRILLLLCFLVYQTVSGTSQTCTPPSADNCDAANVLCSLDELNGFICQSVDYSNPTACLGAGTSCPNGVPHNSSWWAFVTNGGFVSITVTFSGCVNGQGLQIGVVGACDCSGQISCNSNCSFGGSITISGNLVPCKTYYLWVDGCNGDICTFNLSTSGGAPPKLSNFALSRTSPNPICVGCCDDFKVTPQPGGCEPEYVWTIDGCEVTSGSAENVNLCFPEEGTFSVCVQAIIGLDYWGHFCNEMTKCMSVTVTKKKDEIAKPRIYCPEKLPVWWYCEYITRPGEYRCQFKVNGFNGCCEFDSVLKVEVLPISTSPSIYFIGCANEVYYDSITKTKYQDCLFNKEILLKKSSSIYRCDSTYLLNTYYPSFTTEFQHNCDSGRLEIQASIRDLSSYCGHNLKNEFSYRWYNKQKIDSTIGTLKTLTIVDSGIYCMELSVLSKLGNVEKICKFRSCEQISEDQFLEINSIGGEEYPYFGKIEGYNYFPPKYKVKKFEWRIEGGIIIDSLSTDPKSIFVKWNDGNDSVGKVCLKITTDCYESKEYCKLIKLKQKTSIEDLYKHELIHIYPNPNKGTFSIINNTNEVINSIKIYNAKGKEINFTSQKTNEITTINLNVKTDAIYFLQLNTSNGILVKKVIITK